MCLPVIAQKLLAIIRKHLLKSLPEISQLILLVISRDVPLTILLGISPAFRPGIAPAVHPNISSNFKNKTFTNIIRNSHWRRNRRSAPTTSPPPTEFGMILNIKE